MLMYFDPAFMNLTAGAGPALVSAASCCPNKGRESAKDS